MHLPEPSPLHSQDTSWAHWYNGFVRHHAHCCKFVTCYFAILISARPRHKVALISYWSLIWHQTHSISYSCFIFVATCCDFLSLVYCIDDMAFIWHRPLMWHWSFTMVHAAADSPHRQTAGCWQLSAGRWCNKASKWKKPSCKAQRVVLLLVLHCQGFRGGYQLGLSPTDSRLLASISWQILQHNNQMEPRCSQA